MKSVDGRPPAKHTGRPGHRVACTATSPPFCRGRTPYPPFLRVCRHVGIADRCQQTQWVAAAWAASREGAQARCSVTHPKGTAPREKERPSIECLPRGFQQKKNAKKKNAPKNLHLHLCENHRRCHGQRDWCRSFEAINRSDGEDLQMYDVGVSVSSLYI